MDKHALGNFIKIKPRSRIRNKLSHLCLKWRKLLENEIQGDITRTGEGAFLKAFLQANNTKPLTVFDVGANVGDWSTFLCREAEGPVDLHAFEPIAEFAVSLTQDRATQKIKSIKAAVSEKAGTLQVHKWPSTDQSSVYERRLTHDKQGKPEIVSIPAIRLDDYIRENGITHIDLLKVDVEGHELSVLKSLGEYLKPSFVSAIQFEYGLTYVDSSSYLFDMYRLLKDYRIYKLFKDKLEETPYQSNLEDFMYTNYIALAKD